MQTQIKLPNYFDEMLSRKTQVMPLHSKRTADNALNEVDYFVLHNRKTHSEQVANVGQILMEKWPQYQYGMSLEEQQRMDEMLFLTCMLHDIGQASYGHSLSDLMNEVIGEFDPTLFFDDNSNNLIFLEIYNLKRVLKTLNIDYEENIGKINDILMENNETNYYKKIYCLYKGIDYEEVKDTPLLSTRLINKFVKDLKEENSGLLLDKDLLCYLIKRPNALSRELNIKKGLYPHLHTKYIPHFFKMKAKERAANIEASKQQLNVTWFMDMADEIAYITGDFSNFLNLYYNSETFRTSINKFYPEAEKKINEVIDMVLNNCPFPFQKVINKTTDFNMLENKIIYYITSNLHIDEHPKTNKLEELFITNKDALMMFKAMKEIEYKFYIPFTEANLDKKFNDKKEVFYHAKTFLETMFQNLQKNGTFPNYIIDGIQSDLYKHLIKYNIENGEIKQVAMLYTNYLMELTIPSFDKTLEQFYQRNPKKSEVTKDEVHTAHKEEKKAQKAVVKAAFKIEELGISSGMLEER